MNESASATSGSLAVCSVSTSASASASSPASVSASAVRARRRGCNGCASTEVGDGVERFVAMQRVTTVLGQADSATGCMVEIVDF